MTAIYDCFNVGVDSGVSREVPEGQAPNLIEVAPVEIHLVDHRLATLVFAELGVVEVKGRDLSYKKCLEVGVVACRCYGISPLRYLKLTTLVVVSLHEYEDILVEFHLFLSDAALNHVAVVFSHLYFPFSFSPVDQRDRESQLHNLIVFETAVGIPGIVGGSSETNLCKQVDLSHIAFSLRHFIVGFELAPAYLFGKRIVGKFFVDHFGIDKFSSRHFLRHLWFQVFIILNVKKRLERKHGCAVVAFAIGQR